MYTPPFTVSAEAINYDAIAASTAKADSQPFIDFMLGEILKTLRLP